MSALSEDEVRSALGGLPGWELTGGRIEKEYRLPSFMDAIGFINRIAEAAEAANHHPDLESHYDRVVVALVTHSAGGVTGKDIDLARQVEALASG